MTPCRSATKVKDRGQGSSWLRADIKPWCLCRLWHLAPPWSPVPRGSASLCRAAVFSWPGEACPEPQTWKKTPGEALFPGQEDKQGAGAAGKEKPPRASPLGHPPSTPWHGGTQGSASQQGPSWHPKCTPSPRKTAWGSWAPLGAQPQPGEPRNPPSSCTHLAALGSATPKVVAPWGPPALLTWSWGSQASESPGAP